MCGAVPAYAVDGVIEINQARALAGSVTPQDTPGFPVVLSKQGSYRLTGNLTLPNADTDGIAIAAADVTLDLNGFSIIGPNSCSDCPATTCTAKGSGRGISASGAGGANFKVSNGSILGAGSVGLNLLNAPGVQVEHVRVVGSGGDAIVVGSFARVKDNSVWFNNGNGIKAVNDAQVGGNDVVCNHIAGITASVNALVRDNVANANQAGILVGDGATVVGNTADANPLTGIGTGNGSTVSNNTVRDTVHSPSIGIQVGKTCTVAGNSVSTTGDAVVAKDGTSVTGNTINSSATEGAFDAGAGFSVSSIGGTVALGNNVLLGGTINGAVFGLSSNMCVHSISGVVGTTVSCP